MNNEWILVAGATRARLFEHGAPHQGLSPVRSIDESEAAGEPALRERQATSPLRRRHLRFARFLALTLEHALRTGRCDRITLVAGCPFLGALRQSLDPAVRRAVYATVNMDMSDETPEVIHRRLGYHRPGRPATRLAST